MAVAVARRRTDGDEDRLDIGDRRGEIGREGQPALAHVAGDEFLEARLVDRHHALVQSGDLSLIEIDTGDVMPEIRQTGAGHQADVARTDHGYAQRGLPRIGPLSRERSRSDGVGFAPRRSRRGALGDRTRHRNPELARRMLPRSP